VSITHSLPSHNKHGKFDKMPPKAAISLLVAIISGQRNTSIAKSSDTDSQPIIRG